ncbi:hypothetical protein COO60DRAFT_53694 [Scenedesmus sp. NREL 46B-D3]|nr:hypothetical protein COO60DRAFT_53694 [Scenedesmus sp. NREL 46B-D3]
MLLLATWLWAAVSCSSLAMTPCVSRMGASIWIALRLWNFCGGQLLQGSALAVGLCFVLYQRPSLAVWWATNLVSPMLFVWHLLWVMALSWGNWMGLTQRSPDVRYGLQPHSQRGKPRPSCRTASSSTHSGSGRSSSSRSEGRQERRMVLQARTTSKAGRKSQAAHLMAQQQQQQQQILQRVCQRSSICTACQHSSARHTSNMCHGLEHLQWPLVAGRVRPLELACTCYWWVRMLGWVLPCHALTAVVIACKLSFAAAVFMMAVAALGLLVSR